MRVLDSFVRFDDFLIDKVFTPVSEWFFSTFGITNYKLSQYLCGLVIAIDLYEVFKFYKSGLYSTVAVDVLLLVIMSGVLKRTIRHQGLPPGTASIYRYHHENRFIVFVLNIVTCTMMHPVLTTFVMSNLLVLIFYFMACDTPKGDRLKAFKSHPI